jgi:prephenate dehydrogenase
MDVLIVGAGTMGRWFAGVIDEPGTSLAFADLDPEAAHTAAEAAGGEAVASDVDERGRFDLVCLAVPIPAIEGAIERYAPLTGSAIVDCSGVMATPIDAMAEHAPDRERASLHPLFAPENAPGNVAIVAEGGPIVERLRERLEAQDNTLVETTPQEHDRAMETIQTKAHAAILAYALAAEEVPEGFETPVSAGLSDLVETVTDGNPHVYADIQESFAGAEAVADAAARIAEADREGFEALYREAGR